MKISQSMLVNLISLLLPFSSSVGRNKVRKILSQECVSILTVSNRAATVTKNQSDQKDRDAKCFSLPFGPPDFEPSLRTRQSFACLPYFTTGERAPYFYASPMKQRAPTKCAGSEFRV